MTAAAEVSGGKVGRLTRVEQQRTLLDEREHLVGVEHGRRRVVQQVVWLAVAPGVEFEVGGPRGWPSVTMATKVSSSIGASA